jgi:hypothetical protein
MSLEYAFPPAVVLGLWLNAARSGSVSPTDAANALESVTNEVDVKFNDATRDPEIKPWIFVVNHVIQKAAPVAVAIPIAGDPAGIPIGSLSCIDKDAGVVAISTNSLLVKNVDQSWEVVSAINTVIHYDLNQTRRALVEQVDISARQLAANDLIGDESEILDALESFRTLHLPPSLTKRSSDALELAARVNIIASGAIKSASAIHSPSIDRQRLTVLQKLITESRAVLQSVFSF